VRALVLALDAETTGQQQSPARWAGRTVGESRLRAGVRSVWGQQDVSAAWATSVLAVGAGPAAVPVGGEGLAMSQHQRESWDEWVAIMVTDGSIWPEDAERLTWKGLQASSDARCSATCAGAGQASQDGV